MKTPTIRRIAPLTAVLLALVLALLGAQPAFAHQELGGWHAATLHQVSQHDQLTLAGGTCSSCDDDADEDDDDEPATKVGRPYWTTYKSTVLSTTSTPARLVVKLNNYSPSSTLSESYSYTSKSSLDVGFSGGFANYVKAAIGGEYSQSKTVETRITVPPMTSIKVYVKYWTKRMKRYGRKFQDYSDGTRKVVDTSSGPVTRTWTEKSLVSSQLR